MRAAVRILAALVAWLGATCAAANVAGVRSGVLQPDEAFSAEWCEEHEVPVLLAANETLFRPIRLSA
jgi:hypothetical protein